MNRLCVITLLISIVSLVAFTPAPTLRESYTQDSARPQLTSNISNTTESKVNDSIEAANEEVPSMVNISSDASQVFNGPYFGVTPSVVPIAAVGKTFMVTVALHNVTVEDVPAGIQGLEVHLIWNCSLVEPVNVTNDIGAPDVGVLFGPILSTLDGFYDNNGNKTNSAPYKDAVEYAVAAASTSGPWWSTNSTGTVALITFRVKSAPTSQFTVCSLQLGDYTELCDGNGIDVAYNLVTPLVLDIYLCDGSTNEELRVDAGVRYASYCVLSYTYNYLGKVSDWINETMTKDGNSYNGTIFTSPILGETSVQYRIFAYDCFGRSSKTAISLFETCPLIVNVSDNLQDWGMPESGVVILDAVVQYADNCVLSYMYNSEGNSSGWIREAMAKDGNNYTGAIDCSPIPYHTIVQYRIVAYDNFGHSIETAVSWFAKSNKEEETGPWILNVSDDFDTLNWHDGRACSDSWSPVNINAVVYAANQCVLSWFNGTCWINETMIKNGSDYTGTAGLIVHPGDNPDFEMEYKVTAYDGFGHSSETAIVSNGYQFDK
jgi:hypothetical protein